MQRVAVLERVHGDRLRAELDGCAERPDGDLPAVGYQDLREHAGLSTRFPHSEHLGIARGLKVTYLFVHVLCVSSLKGGVGKTTVTLGLASAAFARGVRTLVVDLDPQSDVSTGMDIQMAGHLNVADVLASPKEKIVRSAIAPSGWARSNPSSTIDVMIGSPSAINFDGPHPSIRDIWKLEEALANVEADYELVLIDAHRRSTRSPARPGPRATAWPSSPSPASSRSPPPTVRSARSRRSAAASPPAPAARHHRQPRPGAVARAPVPHQGAARHVRPARALAAAARAHVAAAGAGRGEATPHVAGRERRGDVGTSTSSSNACCAPPASPIRGHAARARVARHLTS